MHINVSLISGIIGLTLSILLVLICCRRNCRRLKNKIVKEKNNRNDNHRHKTINSVSAVCTIPPSPIIVDSVPPTPNTLNSETKNEYYAAPLELLPQNFDYNDPKVILKETHVLINGTFLSEDLVYKSEYSKQEPYNPNFTSTSNPT